MEFLTPRAYLTCFDGRKLALGALFQFCFTGDFLAEPTQPTTCLSRISDMISDRKNNPFLLFQNLEILFCITMPMPMKVIAVKNVGLNGL